MPRKSPLPRTGVSQEVYDSLKKLRPYTTNFGRARFGYSILEQAYVPTGPGDPMDKYYVVFEPTISREVVEQQTPANPGIRQVAVSTYGVTVPVSVGRRVITGNIIDAEPITPRLEGAYEYTVEERTPIYDLPGPS